MPIKKVSVSFDVPITAFLSLIASGHSEMKISLYGDEAKPKKTKMLEGPTGVKLLAPPQRGKNMQAVALKTLADGAPHATSEIREAVVSAGFSAASVSNLMYVLRETGLVASTGHGLCKLTADGRKAVAHG